MPASPRLNTQLPRMEKPWDTRFGWFWYNDEEIFNSSEADIERKVEEFAANGINCLITFSCTHFRWSFRRYWPLLNETIAKIARACHRHNIYLIEHHSSHLTFNPIDAKSEEFMAKVLRVRKASLTSWPELRADCDRDPLVGDHRLSGFRQIDGSTGEPVYTGYGGYAMCFNNPHYRHAYFAYLEGLYALGIDGIMTDDVQYFGAACSCHWCRRLFKEKTGLSLPLPGKEWNDWFGNYEDLSFVAWIKFRYESVKNFHIAVMQHYQSLGLDLLRPNYCSSSLGHILHDVGLEDLPALDWIFQECCFSAIIRYSWLKWAREQAHRYSLARIRGIPSMAMFYPDGQNALIFVAALAWSWGALFTVTPEGAKGQYSETPLRNFENSYRHLLQDTQKAARLAFYNTARNRQLSTVAFERQGVWVDACTLYNIPYDFFMDTEIERLKNYKTVVLDTHVIMDDSELDAFRNFVADGGTVILSSSTGSRNVDGRKRSNEELSHAFGIFLPELHLPTNCHKEYSFQKGRYLLISDDFFTISPIGHFSADRWQNPPAKIIYHGDLAKNSPVYRQLAALLFKVIGHDVDLMTENLPFGILVTIFRTVSDTLAVHLINAAGAFDIPAETLIGHEDLMPYPDLSAAGDAVLHLRIPAFAAGKKYIAVRLLRYDSDEIALKVECLTGFFKIHVPLAVLKDYVLLEIAFDDIAPKTNSEYVGKNASL